MAPINERFINSLLYTDDINLHAKLTEWERFYNYATDPHSAMNGKTLYECLIEKLR